MAIETQGAESSFRPRSPVDLADPRPSPVFRPNSTSDDPDFSFSSLRHLHTRTRYTRAHAGRHAPARLRSYRAGRDGREQGDGDGGGDGGAAVPGAVGAALRGRRRGRRRRRRCPGGRADIVGRVGGGRGAAPAEGGRAGAAGAAAAGGVARHQAAAVARARPGRVGRGRRPGRAHRAAHLGGDARQVGPRGARLRDQVLHAATGMRASARAIDDRRPRDAD